MEEGLRLRLMICEQCKLLSLQEKMEMLNRGVGIEEFSVKGRELGFSIGEVCLFFKATLCAHLVGSDWFHHLQLVMLSLHPVP